MLDIALLRTMKNRKDFYNLRDLIPEGVVEPNAMEILRCFDLYFQKFPEQQHIVMKEFGPRFKAWHPGIKTPELNVYIGVMREAIPDATDDEVSNITQELSEHTLIQELANLSDKFSAGELPDVYATVSAAFDKYKFRRGIVEQSTWIDIPIGDLMQDEFDDVGVRWRLDCLNRSMRALRPGDFGIIAARPDQGKTSFIASEVTHMAAQLPQDRNVLWLNNEGPGRRIIPRLYQAALGLSMTQMKDQHSAGHLEPAYIETVGRRDRIRVVDIHGFSNGQVETLIEDNNPGIIVYDMIDNIRGFGSEARTDLQLEAMYQWARERSVKYDCVGLATSQISAEGGNMQFPPMSALKDSKTGKQGACDFQIMIGSVDDPNLRNSRFIGVPKNKLRRADGPGNPQQEVLFDGNRSRYNDIAVEGIQA